MALTDLPNLELSPRASPIHMKGIPRTHFQIALRTTAWVRVKPEAMIYYIALKWPRASTFVCLQDSSLFHFEDCVVRDGKLEYLYMATLHVIDPSNPGSEYPVCEFTDEECYEFAMPTEATPRGVASILRTRIHEGGYTANPQRGVVDVVMDIEGRRPCLYFVGAPEYVTPGPCEWSSHALDEAERAKTSSEDDFEYIDDERVFIPGFLRSRSLNPGHMSSVYAKPFDRPIPGCFAPVRPTWPKRR